ncbi:hypothetical protein HDV03_001581 [Kappamyces sp. JEL0829]|nr:hypothetical protein HDV03_001581 [Kappamyces sp. JEL0829]
MSGTRPLPVLLPFSQSQRQPTAPRQATVSSTGPDARSKVSNPVNQKATQSTVASKNQKIQTSSLTASELQELQELRVKYETLGFRYTHLQSLLLESEHTVREQKKEIRVLRSTIKDSDFHQSDREAELLHLLDVQNRQIQDLTRQNEILAFHASLAYNSDPIADPVDPSAAKSSPQDSPFVLNPSPLPEPSGHLMDMSLVGDLPEPLNASNGAGTADDMALLQNEINQIEALLEKDEKGVLFGKPEDDSQSLFSTFKVDKIYRTGSKDFVVQKPVDVLKSEFQADAGDMAPEPSLNVSANSILKPARPPTAEITRLSPIGKPTVITHVSPSFAARSPSKSPSSVPVYPDLSQKLTAIGSSIAKTSPLLHTSVLEASDRYLHRDLSKEWRVPSPTPTSQPPSPTKSMLVQERDALEEELLTQYGRLRKLENMEQILLHLTKEAP